MKNLLFSVIAFLITFSATAKQIDARDFGAIPNDGKDDTKALRKAAEYCRNNPGTTLYIQPGVYRLIDKEAEKLEERAYAGELGENVEEVIFTPYYPYAKGLDFSGSVDTQVLAEDVTLLCEGWMEPISIIDAKNFKLSGITIDYLRKPFSQGEVVSIGNGYFDIRFSEERTITTETPLMRMTFWMPTYNRVAPTVLYFPERELLGDNVVRFHHQIDSSLVGSTACVIHSFHFRPAVLVLDSENTVLENVTIHSQPGMGVVGFDSKDILLKNLSVKPAPGYYQSTNTDATHFAACEGVVRFEACYFQGQGDDATNVHGYYQTINHASGRNAQLQIKARTYTHAQVIDAPRISDVLELVEKKTLKPIKNYEVRKVKTEYGSVVCEVELSEELPTDCSAYYLMNITKLPKFEFENCLVNSHLARGVLVKTRGVKINNNVFRYCTGTAIHVGAESSWHEGSHAKDVTITHNMIFGCGSGSGSQAGASGIAVVIEAPDTDKSFLHDNILIRDNMILGEGNDCGIYVGNSSNVKVEGNRVMNCKTDILTHSVQNMEIRPE